MILREHAADILRLAPEGRPEPVVFRILVEEKASPIEND